jgi:hypothetical protein
MEVLLELLGSEEAVFAGTPLESVEKAFRCWKASDAGKVYARMPYVIDIR